MATAPPLPPLNCPGVARIPGKGTRWDGTKGRGPPIQRVRIFGGAIGVDQHGEARGFFLARTPTSLGSAWKRDTSGVGGPLFLILDLVAGLALGPVASE